MSSPSLSTTAGSSPTSLSSAGNSSATSSNFFRPEPVQPPRQGITPAQYENYLKCYKAYTCFLDDFKEEFWSERSRSRGSPGSSPLETPIVAYNRGVIDAMKKLSRPSPSAKEFCLAGPTGQIVVSSLTYAEAVGQLQYRKGATVSYADGVPVSPEIIAAATPQPEKPTSRVASPARKAARRRQKANRKARDLAADTQRLSMEREHAEAQLAYAKVAKSVSKLVSAPTSKTTPKAARSAAKGAPLVSSPAPTVPVTEGGGSRVAAVPTRA